MAAQGREIDAVLVRQDNGTYDIEIVDGDINTKDSFDTAIIVSVLSDRRANESEALLSERRRGWIGNEYTPGFEIGSKLWLFEQSRLTRQTINQAADVVRDSLLWMVEEGLAVTITNVRAEFLPPSSPQIGADIIVEIERSNSKVEQRYFDFWPQTAVQQPFAPTGVVEPPPPGLPTLTSTQSLDFNGSSEAITEQTPQDLSIANVWSVASWVKFAGTANDQKIQVLGDVNGINSIDVSTVISSGNRFEIRSDDFNSSGRKVYTTGATYVTGTWYHLTVTWDGTNYLVYVDGTLDVPFSFVPNLAMVQTNTNRPAYIGVHSNLGQGFLDGRVFSSSVWDVALGASEIADLAANSLTDYRQDFLSYVNSANLQHYHVYGENPGSTSSMLGDLGVSATPLDYNSFGGVSTSNLVTDTP